MKLEEIQFATPCIVPWELMKAGADERVRFCGKCSRNVFNLSLMTRAEAEAFIEKTNGSECIQLWKRPDGTIVTSDCGRPVPPQRPVPLGGAPMPAPR